MQQNLEAARRAAEDAALSAENRHAKAVADGQATTQAAVAAGEAAVAATTTRLNEQRKRELEAAAKRKADELAAAQRQHEAAQRRLSQEHAQALAQREAELRDERRAGEEALVAQHGAAVIAPGPRAVASVVRRCLDDPAYFARLREAARGLSHPNAAESIAVNVVAPLL